MNGYARIIFYHKQNGIIQFEEGHFIQGLRDGFGRFMIQEMSSDSGTSATDLSVSAL